MSKPIEDKLLSIMADKFDIEPGKITPTTSFEAMDVDSLVLVELSVLAEKQFGVRLGDAGTIRGAALLLRDNGVTG
ncbi:acyl carrier protein [Stackebrandtia nassauensis]|uniref:Phosphopantetheine-binding protein n=1 Tax=Stackebrandtia nassauensis (strain DSM 44728 / CIP 108903 / NRRL B-16338 / NBRC 102104 / LLR-40K-21) TaxID=446470 RepID=D3Q630_STANL|nr:phosphopantetheine-binding protein [Stackebrandtia nassauensis]ADD42205.1 phosphopantetheine-binding protein [Stackebrandtia nassauensis DSM 44728]